jgi:hypothetical protein
MMLIMVCAGKIVLKLMKLKDFLNVKKSFSFSSALIRNVVGMVSGLFLAMMVVCVMIIA